MSDDAVNLRELLQKPMSDFPELPDLPGGKHFYGKLLGVSATHSKLKGTPGFHFDIRLTDPGKDVPPETMKKVADAGFSLSDYNIGSDQWLTPASMKVLRRLLTSLGFSSNLNFIEALSLDPETCNPTADTNEKIRGLDVLVTLPAATDHGRVFLNNVDMIGIKRD